MMFEQIPTILQKDCSLKPGCPILAGVSGGPDSLCLAVLLQRSGYPVIVAHYNHHLRPEAGDDARFVAEFAEANGMRCVGSGADVAEYAEIHSLSIEEAARQLRYQYLFAQAQLWRCQAVAVGHTADDQVETVLMHLLRGSGLAGLRGMVYRSLPNTWSAEVPLVRPLLGIWRSEILDFCAANGLQPVQDASNLERFYFRNRLRLDLLPILESYNPRFRPALWRMANILGADYEVLEGQAEAAWQECQRAVGEGYICLGRSALLAQPLGIQRAVIRRAVALLRPGIRDIDFAVVDRATDFIASPPETNQADLFAGLKIALEGELLWLRRVEADLPGVQWPQLLPGQEFELEIPGNHDLSDGWQFVCELLDDPADARRQAQANADPFQAWFDLDSLSLPLLVRGRRAGDTLSPLGMGGHSLKLSDFMINCKVPRRARARWPLVVSGNHIAWVPGFRLAHPFRLKVVSLRVIHLSLL
jgi:tRNA(Ile)-lysidine synthase